MSRPHVSDPITDLITGVTLVGLLLITFAIYWPGCFGVFILDDFPNLEPLGRYLSADTQDRLVTFVMSGRAGNTGRPLALASFLINDFSWPSDPWPFKYTNVLIHALNGALVFWVTLLLCRINPRLSSTYRLFIPLAVTGAWLLHPLHVATVLYVIQRMALLATLFMLVGLVCYIKGRMSSQRKPFVGLALMTVGIVTGGGLGILSKELAVLLPVYVLAIEYILLVHVPRPSFWRLWSFGFLWLPITGVVGWHIVNMHKILAGYAARPFTLQERLLTEPRVLWDYLAQILIPRRSGTGLFHDDFVVSHSLVEPITTLVACIGILFVVVVALAVVKRLPLFSFAVFWFLGGHLLESTVVGLELYFEHRNYLPMFGPIFAIVYGLVHLPVAIGRFSYAVIIVFVSLSALATWQNTTLWARPTLLAETWADEHPTSVRAQQFSANFWSLVGRYDMAKERLARMINLNPKATSAHLALLQMTCLSNEQVSSVDFSNILAALRHGDSDTAVPVTIQKIASLMRKGNCPGLTYRHLDQIIVSLLENNNFKGRPKLAGNLYYVSANLHAARRDVESAAKALELAMKYDQTVDLALTRVSVLLSAGRFDQALQALEQARDIDRRSKFGVPSRAKDIDRWERYIVEQKIKSR